MSEDPSSCRTRWSAIDRLHHPDADGEWEWFLKRYQSFVMAVLRQLLPLDQVQPAGDEFWGYLFRSRAIERANRGGRFRSFLAGTVAHYAAWWRRQNAAAGSGDPDQLGRLETLPESTEVAIWAQQILSLALDRLGRSHPADEQVLRWFYGIGGEQPLPGRASAIAARLGCKPNAVHQALFRARARLRDCLMAEVAATIASTRDLDEELLLLATALDRATPGLVDCRRETP